MIKKLYDATKKSLVYLFAIMTIVYTIAINWMLFYPYQPIRADGIDIVNVNGKILSQQELKFHRDDVVYFMFSGKKFMDITSHITIELVNGERIQIMSYDSNTSPGEAFKKRSFIIPYHIQPTKYQIVWTGTYPVNGLRDMKVMTKSKWIEIVADDCMEGKQGIQGIQGKRGKQGVQGKAGRLVIFGK